VHLLPFTSTPEELVEEARKALTSGPAPAKLLAVTGASNVTGEVPPLAALAEAAHEAGALILVDAAQLVPHRPIDMAALGIDYLAISGHKLYAPYGAGALIGSARQLEQSKPMLQGGGAIKLVTTSDVLWADAPERHEAGSPNTVGVVALGAACDALRDIGMNLVVEAEHALARQLWTGLDRITGIRQLRMWPEGSCDRVGVTTFTAAGYPDHLLANVLAAEYGIGVRNGCFCAHPLVMQLLGVEETEAHEIRAEVAGGDETRIPGAVRASLNLATPEQDVREFLAALERIMARGPSFAYRRIPLRNEYVPVNDTRGWPDMHVRLSPAPNREVEGEREIS
jgi:selenocysteine lyase/cysteine desulfurase